MKGSQRVGLVAVCAYRVRAGEEAQFELLLERHLPTLSGLGLISDYPRQTLRCVDADLPMYVEIFEWVSADAAARAAEVPDVIAVWEPMASLCEARAGHDGVEFPFFDRIGPLA